jgi:hypothetical protein
MISNLVRTLVFAVSKHSCNHTDIIELLTNKLNICIVCDKVVRNKCKN